MPGIGTYASLGGIPLAAHQEIGWRLTRGVEPYQRTFEVRREDAEQLQALYASTAKQGLGIDLLLRVYGHGELKIQNLHLLSVAPATHYGRVSILMSDMRWAFNRRHVNRRYNIRRRSGNLRLARNAVGEPFTLQRLDPVTDEKFAKWSLFRENDEWDPQKVLTDVVNQVSLGNFVIYSSGIPVPVQNLELDDDGPGALRRLSAIFPGINYYVNPSGQLVVDSDYSTGPAGELNLAKPAWRVGQTLAEFVSLKQVRPKKVHVFFSCEDELRFDFSTTVAATGDLPQAELRSLDNVLPLPDPSLIIDGKTYYQGAWVPINAALLSKWHTDDPPLVDNKALPELTLDVINLTWITNAWYTLYRSANIETSPLWDRRMKALHEHYRQTFRINRRWVDRIFSFKNERVALLDPETGLRAPADVFMDYSVRPTMRQISKNMQQRKPLFLNHSGYSLLLQNAQPSPARIEIRDKDLGVFHVKLLEDPHGNEADIFPGLVYNIFGDQTPPFDDPGVQALCYQTAKLATDFNLSVVLTVAPGRARLPLPYDADKGDLDPASTYVKERDLTSVASLLSQANVSADGAEGPPWSVHVGAGLLTARFAWLDDHSSAIEQNYINDGRRVTECLINEDQCADVANAVTAQIYAALSDHYEGIHVTSLDPPREPRGRVNRVTHSLPPTGEASTTLEFTPKFEGPDIFAMLPDSLRRIITRQVQVNV